MHRIKKLQNILNFSVLDNNSSPIKNFITFLNNLLIFQKILLKKAREAQLSQDKIWLALFLAIQSQHVSSSLPKLHQPLFVCFLQGF